MGAMLLLWLLPPPQLAINAAPMSTTVQKSIGSFGATINGFPPLELRRAPDQKGRLAPRSPSCDHQVRPPGSPAEWLMVHGQRVRWAIAPPAETPRNVCRVSAEGREARARARSPQRFSRKTWRIRGQPLPWASEVRARYTHWFA